MRRDFVDTYAMKLSPYTHSVYMALCRYADSDGFTFWGCRRLGEILGMNKDTVAKCIRSLIVSGLVRRGTGIRRKVSGIYIEGARFQAPIMSEEVVPKKDIKKDYKEEYFTIPERTPEQQLRVDRGLESLDEITKRLGLRRDVP